MANQKQFDARLRQKVDLLENYLKEDKVYLKGEILFAQMKDESIDIYVGDGQKRFSQLQPLFSSEWIYGRNEVNLNPVQILSTEWVNNEATKAVAGILGDESAQLVIPTWAAESRQIAQACGVDFYVGREGTLVFTCNTPPTEDIICYIGIFGKYSEEENDNTPFIREEALRVDRNFSTVSSNPLENRTVTLKFNSIDALLRDIIGSTDDGELGDDDPMLTLPDLTEQLTNATTYSGKKTLIGTYIAPNTTKKKNLFRIKVPFTLAVNRANMDPDTDISCFTVIPVENINVATLSTAYWSGKASNTGSFFGGFPVEVVNDRLLKLYNVPIGETEYTLSGDITIEYTES